jgi:hypothetical protein
MQRPSQFDEGFVTALGRFEKNCDNKGLAGGPATMWGLAVQELTRAGASMNGLVYRSCTVCSAFD